MMISGGIAFILCQQQFNLIKTHSIHLSIDLRAHILQAKIKRNPSIPEDTRGVINLTINYDANAGILTVRLIEVNPFYKHSVTAHNNLTPSSSLSLGK